MPILNPEPQCYPSDLFTGNVLSTEGQLEGAGRLWWVLHTRPRQEKSVARELLSNAIPHFAPQLERTWLVRGRRRKSFIPMFSSYVFLFGAEQERDHSLSTHRVAKVISVDDQAQFQGDLAQIWQLIQAKVPLTPESRLTKGDQVRVRSGALAGLEGTVIERRAKCRLFVAVRLLQQGVSMEVDDFQLETI